VVTVLLYKSFAVMVTLKAIPAACGLDIAENTNEFALAGVTANEPDAPFTAPAHAVTCAVAATAYACIRYVVTPLLNDPVAVGLMLPGPVFVVIVAVLPKVVAVFPYVSLAVIVTVNGEPAVMPAGMADHVK
jgi:hypothetical protein